MTFEGGKIYGEGYKGLVEDVRCIKGDINTLCNDIKKYKIIEIYSINKSFKINTSEILDLIKDNTSIIVKKFKYIYINKNFFNNELEGFKQLIKIYGEKNINKYTAIKPLFNYKGYNIYGLSSGYNYYTFNELCNKTIDKIKMDQNLFNKFIKDILKSIKILKKNKYIHYDIKPDNIMYCNNRFKLIDWELSKKNKYNNISLFNSGTPIFNHPILFYICGLPYFLCMKYINLRKKLSNDKSLNWINRLKNYKKYNKQTNENFKKIINLNLSRKQLFKKYSKYFDSYAIALTIIYIAEKNNLTFPKKIINNLMKKFYI